MHYFRKNVSRRRLNKFGVYKVRTCYDEARSKTIYLIKSCIRNRVLVNRRYKILQLSFHDSVSFLFVFLKKRCSPKI